VAHRPIKNFYRSTNKNNAMEQVAKKNAHQNVLKNRDAVLARSLEQRAAAEAGDSDHHHISQSKNDHFNILDFITHNQDDPAIKVGSLCRTCMGAEGFDVASRTFSPNFKITFLVVVLHARLTETPTNRSHTKT
jgi:hypothetical protein